MRIFLALLAFIGGIVSAQANELLNIERAAFVTFAINGLPTFVLPSGSTLKFMAATGCDHNTGTAATGGDSGACSGSAGQVGPWATPNHTMNCGEAIVASAGTYNGDFSTWGSVSNCPSTTGGIDGIGGVYAASLVCGASLSGCLINCATGACNSFGSGSSSAMNVSASSWAVEGWKAIGNGQNHLAFTANGCTGTATTVIHHIAFINDWSENAAVGFGAEGCGLTVGGVDEFAVVGTLSHNSNLIAICDSAIVDVAPHNNDASAGTHVFIAGNFAYGNLNNPPCTVSDGEGILLDTFDEFGYTGESDVENNVVYHNSWAGIHVFQQSFVSSTLTMNIHHNTVFGDMVCPDFQPGSTGEINYQINGNFPWTINTYDNIARTDESTQPYGTSPACASTSIDHPYAMAALLNPGTNPVINTGGTGLQNVFFATSGVCDNSPNCAGSNSVIWFNNGTFSTNTYSDPLFTNTTDLLANWIGVPSCTGTDVASCMGWNNASQTAAALTPIADLVPTGSGTSGKGYQPPGPCAPNSLYPTWLKGIVYLQWDGTKLTENAGLITKPCGL